MQHNGWDHGLKVTDDGTGLAGHCGGVLLRKLADQCGLTAALDAALTRAGTFPQLSRGLVVVSMAIAVNTYFLDAFIGDAITGWFAGTVPTKVFIAYVLDLIYWGGAVLTMQIFLCLAYLQNYRPMLALRAEPRMP